MDNRIDSIYARQSAEKKDSISIESQIELCKYELKGGNCKEYKDKGYSGKDTETLWTRTQRGEAPSC